jgi:hypothetical protein
MVQMEEIKKSPIRLIWSYRTKKFVRPYEYWEVEMLILEKIGLEFYFPIIIWVLVGSCWR